MLTLELDKLHAPATLVSPVRKPRPAREQSREARKAPSLKASKAADTVQTGGQEFSQHTSWMIAVRDKRDKQAFAQLFDHFAPRLKGFVMRSGTSAQQAEEIVQDVMLTLWRKSHLFDPHRAQVSAWIYQIARNRQIDVLRKENRPVPEELAQPPCDELDASQIMAVEQEAVKLKDALVRLNDQQREMIEKAYLGEMTHKQISQETGLPLGTIKSRIRLGLERLRHELKGMR